MTVPTEKPKGSSLDKVFRRTPLHRALGVTAERVEGGIALRGTVSAEFVRADGLDTLHGGAVAALLDSATTLAIVAETKQPWATIDLRIDYLRPTKLGQIEVLATVIYAGSTVGRARAELKDAGGKATAVATATLLVDRSFVPSKPT